MVLSDPASRRAKPTASSSPTAAEQGGLAGVSGGSGSGDGGRLSARLKRAQKHMLSDANQIGRLA